MQLVILNPSLGTATVKGTYMILIANHNSIFKLNMWNCRYMFLFLCMLWNLNVIATTILAWKLLISGNDWINVVLCYGLSLPLFWNSAFILLLYFIFNIVLYDGMNHPSLCIFFFFWCYLACDHLDARTPQKCHSWRVHNCVEVRKYSTVVLPWPSAAY
jgi:hypothetical protein